MKYHSKDYQKIATKFIIENKYCGIFADPGLGKTAIVLSAIKALSAMGLIKKILIIAPLLVVKNVWPEEIKKWDQFGNTKIDLCNPENLKKLFQFKPSENPYDLLIVDESSKFKNPTSKRFKLLKKYLFYFKRRIILTGTPIPNSLQDIWSQIYILDLGQALGKNISYFRQQYFYLVNPKYWQYAPKEFASKAIQKKIRPFILPIRSKDYLDIPDLLINNIELRMDKEDQEIYNEIEQGLFTELDKNQLINFNNYMYSKQAAQGAIYKDQYPKETTDNLGYKEIHPLKLEALQNLISELQGKSLLVLFQFTHDYMRIRKYFNEKIPVISSKNLSIINDWNNNKIKMLLGNPASMGHGLNLHYSDCEDICFFALPDNLDHYEQSIRRIYGRQGNEKKSVRVHHLIVKNTVDQATMYRLKTKATNQRALLDALNKYRQWKLSL